MKKIKNLGAAASAFLLVCMLASCLSAKNADKGGPYNWDEYSTVTYDYVRNKDDESRKKMTESYKKIMENQDGEAGIGQVPPGIYADYGYMLVDEGNEEEGLIYLKKEVELYPMSEPFLSKIIARIEENNPGGTDDEDYEEE